MKAMPMQIEDVESGMYVTEDEALEPEFELESADWHRVLSAPHVRGEAVTVALAYYSGEAYVEHGRRGQTVAVMLNDDETVMRDEA